MATKKPATTSKKAKTTRNTAPAKPAKIAPAEQPLAEKSQAQLKREVRARMKHLDSRTSTELVNGALNKQVNGFVDFLREQSVVGLAIGLVLGTQIKQVVDQFIASFVNPLVGLLLPGKGTLADKTFTLQIGNKTGTFGWGTFVMTMISFLFVAAIVYYVFKGLKLDKLMKQDKK